MNSNNISTIMKSYLMLFLCLLLCSTTAFAQRVAVMEFKPGVGVTQEDVVGLSAMFVTYFRPNNHVIIERSQIDQIIKEQGLQKSEITENQIIQIGKILNVSKIVVGDINLIMSQYNIDARIIDVESGTIIATEGETFDGNSFRSTIKKIAESLSKQISYEEPISSSELKIVKIDFMECLNAFPEVNIINENKNKVQAEYDELVKEYNQEYDYYERYAGSWSESMRKTKENELDNLSQKIKKYEEESTSYLERLEKEIMEPIINRIQQIIIDHANKQNIDLILSSEYINKYPEMNISSDITPIIKEISGGNSSYN